MTLLVKSSLKVLLLAGAVFGISLTAPADEAGERALGDKAFQADDYHRAVSFYESALALADAGNKPEAWAENALRLGRAKLFTGDFDGAAKILDEFRKRNPVLSAGTLPGDLMAARGDFDGALKFFSALEKSTYESLALEAKFRKGCVLAGKKMYAGALKTFEELLAFEPAKNYDFYRLLRREYIYVLIKSGNLAKANEVIEKVKKSDSSPELKIIEHLALTSAGNIKVFKDVWEKLLFGETPRPQLRIVELLTSAADIADKDGDDALAIMMLKRALDYAPGERVRQELFKRIINLQSSCDIPGAGETAAEYISVFPDAADSGKVVINVAKLLTANKLHKKALDMLTRIVNNNKVSVADRMSAADTGIAVAEAAKDTQSALFLYGFLIKNSSDTASAVRNMRRYAGYLQRINDLKGSQIQLINAVSKAAGSEKDELLYMLLEVSSAIGDDAKILQTSNILLESKVPLHLACAGYEIGRLEEKNGKYAAARENFLRAAKINDGGKYSVPATYSAALMAFKMKDFRTAADEFVSFAAKNGSLAHAADALYLAADAFNRTGNAAKAREYSEVLLKKYPSSKVSAFKIMQLASERADAGDIHGAVSELEELENSFASDSAIVSEAMLMRARCARRTGNNEAALKISLLIMQNHPLVRAAAEAAMIAGDSEYAMAHYSEAEKYYRRAGNAGGITGEVAAGKLADCQISGFNAKTRTSLAETIELCDKLTTSAKLPGIRLNARYKLGLCHELTGNFEAALQAYEKVIYDALHNKAQGIPVERQWCQRAMESALELLQSKRSSRSLQRGMRLISNMETLGFGGADFDTLRRDFRKKISSKRR